MQKSDIRQVEEIDRQAFPAYENSISYKKELKNSIARYLVAYQPYTNGEKAVSGNGDNSRIKRLFGRIRELAAGEPPTRDKLIGFAGIWLLAGEAHLITFAVREGYRRAHVGEYLLAQVIDTAISCKASLVTLEVRLSNLAAQRLYQKYGFTQRGYRKNYYSDTKENALIMTNDQLYNKDFRERFSLMKKHIYDNFFAI